MKNTADFVVLGSSNVDYVAKVPHLPVGGETIQSDKFSIFAGGKGANQAAAIAKSNKKVVYIGAVGQDNNGNFLKEEMKKSGVNIDYVFEKETSTGVSLIATSKKGENFIITHAGANKKLTKSDIDKIVPVLEKSKYVLLHWDIEKDVGEYFIKKAKELKNKIILNLAPVRPISENILKLVDYLIVNEIEASYLSNLEVKNIEDSKKAGRILLNQVANIIITLGEKGVVIVNKDFETHIAAEKIEAVDSTAAGDTFIGVFASQLIEENILNAVRAANKAAAISVTRYGAMPSIPELAEYTNK
jgi:ribokinase